MAEERLESVLIRLMLTTFSFLLQTDCDSYFYNQ